MTMTWRDRRVFNWGMAKPKTKRKAPETAKPPAAKNRPAPKKAAKPAPKAFAKAAARPTAKPAPKAAPKASAKKPAKPAAKASAKKPVATSRAAKTPAAASRAAKTPAAATPPARPARAKTEAGGWVATGREWGPGSHLDRGLALHRAGKLVEARDAYERAIASEDGGTFPKLQLLQVLDALAAGWAGGHFMRGMYLHRAGRTPEAASAVARATALAPTDGDSWYNLACYRALLGEKPAALYALAAAIRIDPSNAATARDDGDFASLARDHDFAKLTRASA